MNPDFAELNPVRPVTRSVPTAQNVLRKTTPVQTAIIKLAKQALRATLNTQKEAHHAISASPLRLTFAKRDILKHALMILSDIVPKA